METNQLYLAVKGNITAGANITVKDYGKELLEEVVISYEGEAVRKFDMVGKKTIDGELKGILENNTFIVLNSNYIYRVLLCYGIRVNIVQDVTISQYEQSGVFKAGLECIKEAGTLKRESEMERLRGAYYHYYVNGIQPDTEYILKAYLYMIESNFYGLGASVTDESLKKRIQAIELRLEEGNLSRGWRNESKRLIKAMKEKRLGCHGLGDNFKVTYTESLNDEYVCLDPNDEDYYYIQIDGINSYMRYLEEYLYGIYRGPDYFTSFASTLFQKPMNKITREDRAKAKFYNLYRHTEMMFKKRGKASIPECDIREELGMFTQRAPLFGVDAERAVTGLHIMMLRGLGLIRDRLSEQGDISDLLLYYSEYDSLVFRVKKTFNPFKAVGLIRMYMQVSHGDVDRPAFYTEVSVGKRLSELNTQTVNVDEFRKNCLNYMHKPFEEAYEKLLGLTNSMTV